MTESERRVIEAAIDGLDDAYENYGTMADHGALRNAVRYVANELRAALEAEPKNPDTPPADDDAYDDYGGESCDDETCEFCGGDGINPMPADALDYGESCGACDGTGKRSAANQDTKDETNQAEVSVPGGGGPELRWPKVWRCTACGRFSTTDDCQHEGEYGTFTSMDGATESEEAAYAQGFAAGQQRELLHIASLEPNGDSDPLAEYLIGQQHHSDCGEVECCQVEAPEIDRTGVRCVDCPDPENRLPCARCGTVGPCGCRPMEDAAPPQKRRTPHD